MKNRITRHRHGTRIALMLGPGPFWRRFRAAFAARNAEAEIPFVLTDYGADTPVAILAARDPAVVLASAPGPATDPGVPVLRLGAGAFRCPEAVTRVATDPLELGARGVRHLAAQHVAGLRLVGVTGLVARGARIAAGVLGLRCRDGAGPSREDGFGLLIGDGMAGGRWLEELAAGARALPAPCLALRREHAAGPEPEGVPVLGPDPLRLAGAALAAARAVAGGRPPALPLRVPPSAAPVFAGGLRGAHERHLDAAQAFIREHHALDLGVADVARAAGLSTRHLQRLFAAHLGHGPLAEIHRVRVERSLPLLLDRDRPVAAVARAVGFVEADRYTAAFRRHLGTTPGRWRVGL